MAGQAGCHGSPASQTWCMQCNKVHDLLGCPPVPHLKVSLHPLTRNHGRRHRALNKDASRHVVWASGEHPAGNLITSTKSHLTTFAGSNEPDLAVFRFTLGIPGFDDANIPRVIGVLCLLLLVLNHAFGSSSPAPAQVGPGHAGSCCCLLRRISLLLLPQLCDTFCYQGRSLKVTGHLCCCRPVQRPWDLLWQLWH